MFWFIAYRTRNITVAASFFRFYECFLFCAFRFFVLEQGILISEGTYFALWLKEGGILLLERACFASWLIHVERGNLLLEHASLSVIERGIQSNHSIGEPKSKGSVVAYESRTARAKFLSQVEWTGIFILKRRAPKASLRQQQ